MSVTAPPPTSRPGHGVRDEFDELVEALIEEARQRARRRRRRVAAAEAFVAIGALAVATLVEGAALSQGAAPAAVPGTSASARSVGTRIALVAATPGGGYELSTVNADGSGRATLARFAAWFQAPSPVWSPDGRAIAFMISPPGETEEIAVIDAAGGSARVLTHHPASDQGLVWSPDGRRIAFTRASYATPESAGVVVMNADGSDQQRLATGTLPVWSPDGRRIAFASNQYGRPGGIYTMNADGGARQQLTRNDASPFGDVPLAWSPDATRLLFAHALGEDGAGASPSRVDLYVMHADGRDQRLVVRGVGTAVWSPDGRTLLYASRDGIHVVNADGSGGRQLTNEGESPAWSPDGQRIVFLSRRASGPGVYVMNADGTGQLPLSHHSSDVAFSWSPVGTG